MFSIRFAIPIVAIAALAFPSVSSANTGSVKCDSTGVVFSYNANFNPSRVSTETVNGVTQQFTVPRNTAVTHTWPGVTGTITAGATWTGGQIKPVVLHCPPPPPETPVTPPETPVAPPAVPVAPPAVPVAPPAAPPAAPLPTPSVAPTPEATPAKVSLHKRALAKTVAAGSTVRYQLVVQATGGTAHGVVVCDKLPEHMTYKALGKATLQNGKACWTIGDLSGSRTLWLTAKVDADAPAGTITNNATVTSNDSGRANASANVKVPAKHGVKGKLKRSASVTGAAGVTG